MLKLTIVLIIAVQIIANMKADEEVDVTNCDSVMNFLIEPEDKNLVSYIIRYDLKKEYPTRNDNNDNCFEFINKILFQIEYYKQSSAETEVDTNKRSNESFDRYLKSKLKRSDKPLQVRKPFYMRRLH